jgi:hypothetical protein
MASSLFIFPFGGTVTGSTTFSSTVTFADTGTWSSTGIALPSASTIAWNGDTTLARGGAAGKLVLTGTTPMIQLGGTTSGFVGLKQVTGGVAIRTADDGANALITADTVSTVLIKNLGTNNVIFSGFAPTISSGFGTSPSIANNNGTASFVVNVGTGGTATNGVIGMPTATNGWVAHCIDITAAAAHTGLRTVQTASATNSITIESQNSAGAATAWATGSLVRVIAMAY